MMFLGAAVAAWAGPLPHPDTKPLSTLQQVHRITLRYIHGPGRGNMGAVVIAARQLRRAGFDGDLTILITPPALHAREVLAELLPGYDRNSASFVQTVALDRGPGLGTVEVVTTLPMVLGANYDDSPTSDLELRFAAGIARDFNFDSKVSISTDLLSYPASLARVTVNKGLGKSWDLPYLHTLRGIGLYGDDLFEGFRTSPPPMESARATVGAALRAQSSPSQRPWYEDIAQAVESWDQSRTALGVLYGLAFYDSARVAVAYARAVAQQPSPRRGALLLLANNWSEFETLLLRDELTGFEQSIHFVDVIAGEVIPSEIPPGQVIIAHVGGLPRDAFAHLIHLSDLPPLAEGDSTVSALVALGRPFFLAPSPHNEQMLKSLGAALGGADTVHGQQMSRLWNSIERGDDGVPDFTLMNTAEARQAFLALAHRFDAPLAVSLALIADRVLQDPQGAHSTFSRWAADSDGVSPEACADFLRGTSAAPSSVLTRRQLARAVAQHEEQGASNGEIFQEVHHLLLVPHLAVEHQRGRDKKEEQHEDANLGFISGGHHEPPKELQRDGPIEEEWRHGHAMGFHI